MYSGAESAPGENEVDFVSLIHYEFTFRGIDPRKETD